MEFQTVTLSEYNKYHEKSTNKQVIFLDMGAKPGSAFHKKILKIGSKCETLTFLCLKVKLGEFFMRIKLDNPYSIYMKTGSKVHFSLDGNNEKDVKEMMKEFEKR